MRLLQLQIALLEALLDLVEFADLAAKGRGMQEVRIA
jgi:hypothetical protein